VDPANVRGTIEVRTTVDNAPTGATVELFVDGTSVGTGQPAAMPAAGSSGPQPVPSEITLSINTAEITNLTTGAVRFTNGPKTLKAVLFTRAPKTEIINQTQVVTFANLNSITVQGPGGNTGSNWFSGVQTFTGIPIIYTPGVTAQVRFQGTSSSGPDPDFGGGSGLPGPLVLLPFQTTLAKSLNPNLESSAQITATAYDQQGQPIVSSVGGLTIRLDNLDPRVNLTSVPPPISSLGYEALQLTYQTGGYTAGSIIPLSRITNGTRMGPHLGACIFEHMHSAIFIMHPTSGVVEGPFTDPWTDGRNDACGHGAILGQTHPFLTFTFQGGIVDASLTSATLSVYRAVGTCDGPLVIDDVLATPGTGPGQVNTPVQNLLPTAASFNVGFNVYGGQGFSATDLCVLIDAIDAASNKTGVLRGIRLLP
jgi:hypothetical protein